MALQQAAATSPVRPRFPAHGRTLMEKRRQGLAPLNGRVWIFDHWPSPKAQAKMAEFGWYAVVGPERPTELDYTFVAGLDTIVVAQSMFDAIALSHCVLPFRPLRLTLLCPSGHVDMPWPK